MRDTAARRKHHAKGSMRGAGFYVLFFGSISLLWAIVTVFGHR
jgi:hypothetical protein